MINGLKIGIALGSGSARGWSHIGVLRALLRHGIEPDIIAGTSIGALVGACYAAGKLDELETWVTGLGWRDVVSLLDVKLNGGLIEGRKVFQFFEQHMQDLTFDQLHKPFAAVATDLQTGREIWLQHGHLAEAVRASISIPGLFTPYRAQSGRYMVDGGLVNPVPVTLCRAQGADLVIAVNLNAEIVGKHLRNSRKMSTEFAERQPDDETPPEPSQDQKDMRKAEGDFLRRISQLFVDSSGNVTEEDGMASPGVMDVIASSINIMQDRVTRSRMAGDPADLVLTPRLSHLGLMEFYRAAEAIAEGEQTVEYSLPMLKNLLGLEEP
jgi:NTE family protein